MTHRYANLIAGSPVQQNAKVTTLKPWPTWFISSFVGQSPGNDLCIEQTSQTLFLHNTCYTHTHTHTYTHTHDQSSTPHSAWLDTATEAAQGIFFF